MMKNKCDGGRTMRLGALEAGGTKMVCAIGDEHGNVFERESFPTRKPEETMPDIINYFKEFYLEMFFTIFCYSIINTATSVCCKVFCVP